ncbi:hypothetical protein [Ktedonobacter racemifer]|uniref:hypothetical protein n=1 Tax=Ktedonobacter racemifer TaxID=363277 RepID=UPI00058D6BFF|nr:hypothetical protein [Ktedonobacter racemifer]
MTKHDQQTYTNLFARPFMPFTGLNDLVQPSPITSTWAHLQLASRWPDAPQRRIAFRQNLTRSPAHA